MNISDYEAPPDAPKDWPSILRAIFAKQEALMVKYKDIEQLPDAPISLHHPSGQRILRDFAWRSTEELTESYEAWIKHTDKQVAELHAVEELADSVHFLVELLIFAGITPEQCLAKYADYPPINKNLPMPAAHFAALYWVPTYNLGVAMNFLRNKAWKQSPIPTDEARFRDAIIDAYGCLVELWAALGYDQHVLYAFYMRKSKVNEFRQRSNY